MTEIDQRITFREMLQHFGLCNTPEESTFDAGKTFFGSFTSLAAANNLISALFHRLDTRSQFRFHSFLSRNFPEIIVEEMQFCDQYQEPTTETSPPGINTSPWLK